MWILDQWLVMLNHQSAGLEQFGQESGGLLGLSPDLFAWRCRGCCGHADSENQQADTIQDTHFITVLTLNVMSFLGMLLVHNVQAFVSRRKTVPLPMPA